MALPGYIQQRNDLFEALWQRYLEELQQKEKSEITIELAEDGKEPVSMKAKTWETTPAQLLRHVDKGFASQVVVAKIDGELWDLDRRIERACKISYVPFSATEGRMVFWHSSAHILGEACECHYHCHLSHGPPVEEGFFYDMRIGEGEAVKETDLPPLQDAANKVMKEKQPFDRLWVSKLDLEKMFGYSKYKMHYIEALLPEEGSTVYRCGSLVDLCRGPHIQNTAKVKAFKIMKNSSCYFLGDKDGDSLQRIYGVAFPDKKLLSEHLNFLEQAAKRDHRRIGKDQELFMFDELSPGSPFFLPNGTRIYNAVQSFIREEYFSRNYQEVISPIMFDSDLWKTSGHWAHYSDNVFKLEVEKRTWALKPMNCPGHCKIFASRERSYRELPLRMADFGVLHRNEASGALAGLTRVRKFTQDDAHVFCTLDQVKQEIELFFDFLSHVYQTFGLDFSLELSTRPEKYLGDVETWNIAEEKLTQALNNFCSRTGRRWELNPGDGAFYGPKVDIALWDALKRSFQCATLQLDFQLPNAFNLNFMTDEGASKASKDRPTGESTAPIKGSGLGPGYARPVMLHRAICGSFERFIGVLTEHFAGRWPFWLSPRQVLVVPVMPAVNEYVVEVQARLRKQQIYADIDISGNTMQKKILRGQQSLYNFIFVVGAQERESKTVNIRNRDDPKTQSKGELVPLDEAIAKLVELRDQRRLVNAIEVKKGGDGKTAGEGSVEDSLRKAEARIAELAAKLKEVGLN